MSKELDQKLRAWADRRTPDGERLRSLVARAGREQPRADEPEPRPVLPRRSVAACAAVLILAGFAICFPHRVPAPVATESILTSADLRVCALLQRELGQLFGSAFRSAVLTPAGMQLDVESGVEAAGGNRLLVRIVVQRRSGDRGAWSPVWQADVLTAEQDSVRVGSPRSGSLALWLLRTPNGRFVLDGSGNLPVFPEQRLSIVNVVKPGALAELQTFRRNGETYRVVGEVHALETHA